MKHRALVWITGAVLAALALPLGAALPAYLAKPANWTSKLAANAGPSVTDAQLAQWVKNAQGNPARFSFLGAFHQCYGGGFLTELANKGVVKYGANSASRYFEPASYDLPNARSYFTFAWGWRAVNPAVGATDLTLTDDAYNLTKDGINPPAAPPVPDNPWAAWENAQYLSDAAAAAPPERIAAAQNNYAILWAGQPDNKDLNDINQLVNVLMVSYGYARNNIYILYGPGGAVAGAPWSLAQNAQATAANLQAAFATWLTAKLNAQPMGQTAQVFLWAGDHGSADFPILISVDNASVGKLGSDVNNLVGGGFPPGPVVYEAGSGTNKAIWDILGGDVDAIAFSEQSVPMGFQTQQGGWIYFSVDIISAGAAGSDVNREVVRVGSASANVYSATPNSNRLAFDSPDLGLLPGGIDELDALSLRNIGTVLDPVTKLPNRPLFFSFLGSSQVHVFDPALGGHYLYYDFLWNFPVAPWELDALALWDDGARNPANGLLYFNPAADPMLFSVGRQENAFPWNAFNACDVLKLGPNGMGGAVLTQWRFCNQIGLVPHQDNLDALDLGIGTYGQPVPDYPSYPPPSYPPYPPRTPTPPYMGADPQPVPGPTPEIIVQPSWKEPVKDPVPVSR